MKHFIVKNGQEQTGKMPVFEAVEELKKFKGIEGVEIHSLPDKWAVKENGSVNQRRVFSSPEEAEKEIQKITNDKIMKKIYKDTKFEIVGVRVFYIWYRQYDDKDFIGFYSDKKNLCDAVDEAMKKIRGFMAIDYDGEVVSRHGENFIKEPEKRR